MFVAVANAGSGNRVMTSTDGINWTGRAAASNSNLWVSVCYGNGLFVAVASNGTNNRIMTSSDGITWTGRSPAANDDWRSICYGKGKFVAVGKTVNTMTGIISINLACSCVSADGGETWDTYVIQDVAYALTSVCYSEKRDMFVAVASGAVVTSLDGMTWTGRQPASSNAWTSVCYSETRDMFAAVAVTGTNNRVMTNDGKSVRYLHDVLERNSLVVETSGNYYLCNMAI
jgi:hypothetical protein